MKTLDKITQDYKVEKTLKGESYHNEMLNLDTEIKQIYIDYYAEIGFKGHHMTELVERTRELGIEETMTDRQITIELRNILKTMKLIVKVNAMELKLEEEMEKMK